MSEFETKLKRGPGCEVSWAIDTSDAPNVPNRKFYRLSVEIDAEDSGLVEVCDALMTSSADAAQKMLPYNRIVLTKAEALWLAEVLPGAVSELWASEARLEEESRKVDADAAKARRVQ